MKIGVIADDFTGASDIALTLAEAGMQVAQFNGVPTRDAPEGLEAGVIALKSRTAPVGEAVAASLAACEWLLAQGAVQIISKVCSTFDSTPKGNIGPVLDALADKLGAGPVPVCPAFPENGRSVYQGHLFVGDRLLNESGMQDHPLTPMRDADLRRVLAAQSSRKVAAIPMAIVSRGSDAIRDEMTGDAHVIVDAISEQDLIALGRACEDLPLLCGGSGIALGLPANFGARPKTPAWTGITGPGVVLSGSCSQATRAQVAAYIAQAIAPAREVLAADAIAGEIDIEALADWAIKQTTPPLIYSSAEPDAVRVAQEQFGAGKTAHAIETVFSDLAAALVARGALRIVVAGGETSGAVITGLGLQSLHIGPRAAAGVPLVRAGDLAGELASDLAGDLALALKSGNFGGPDFFAETLALMETDG